VIHTAKGERVAPLRWTGDSLQLLDQRLLPTEEKWIDCRDESAVASAIKDMVVRGAPAIGLAAAFGLALAAKRGHDVVDAAARLRNTRPTAVNLAWAIERMLDAHDRGADLVREAEQILTEDVESNMRIGHYGAELLGQRTTVLTHCNAGALATGGYGSAVGALRTAWERGVLERVWVDETRPLLQGSRLTAWELETAGIPHAVIADSAAASLMAAGEVDCVVTGADRIAANGDTANKIGTYSLAVLAAHHGIPLYVVAPTSTVDLATPSGAGIPIEERAADEITTRFAARNPAFDITPADLIAAIVTEHGVHRAPYAQSLAALV